MLTSIDKAWVALLAPIGVFMAEAVLSGERTPLEAVSDPNTWIMALASAVLVWAVPNKEAE